MLLWETAIPVGIFSGSGRGMAHLRQVEPCGDLNGSPAPIVDRMPSGSGQLSGRSWIDARHWGQRTSGTPIVFLEGHRRNRNGHPR